MLNKLFCSHKWKTHTKVVKEYQQYYRTGNVFDQNTQYKKVGGTTEKTIEVLICEHCGKIKKITY